MFFPGFLCKNCSTKVIGFERERVAIPGWELGFSTFNRSREEEGNVTVYNVVVVLWDFIECIFCTQIIVYHYHYYAYKLPLSLVYNCFRHFNTCICFLNICRDI